MEIITNKTAYYTIFLPVFVGLVLTKKKELYYNSLLQEICSKMGVFFQIRDDFLDVFADASVLGKKGTDIQEGKCSWVVLNALERCSESEKETIQKHYGKASDEDVLLIREIFDKFPIKAEFEDCEKTVKERVTDILRSPEFPVQLIPFFNLLSDKLFGVRV